MLAEIKSFFPSARRSLALLALAALVAGGTGGCASIDELDRSNDTARGALNARLSAEKERDELRLANEQLRGQLGRSESGLSELQAQNAALRKAMNDSGMSLDDLQKKLAALEFGPLDEKTDQALQQLAAQYPDLIKYDSARGMLRFASDLTFDSGSAIVKDSARSSIDALGKILTTSSASGYEVHIAGHTDSQRISSSTSKLHPTNVHLSCHRAISVREELTKLGVAPTKIMAAGWGEFRPLVANSSNGNTPQNRRVEIFLARATGDSSISVSEPTETARIKSTPERNTTPTRQPDITK